MQKYRKDKYGIKIYVFLLITKKKRKEQKYRNILSITCRHFFGLQNHHLKLNGRGSPKSYLYVS